MAKTEQPMEERGAGQLSADFVSRLEAREASPEAEGTTDFATVLENLPPTGLDGISDAFAPSPAGAEKGGNRDRNLSRVIGRIRDEGPADLQSGELEEDVLELSSAVPAAVAGKEPEPAVESAKKTGTLLSEDASVEPESFTRGKGPGIQPLLNLVLLGAVAVLGLLYYGQMESERRLQVRLEQMESSAVQLQRIQSSLQERLTEIEKATDRGRWVSKDELTAALAARDKEAKARLDDLDAMALSFFVPLQPLFKATEKSGEATATQKGMSVGVAAKKSVQKISTSNEKRSPAGRVKAEWGVVLLSSSSRQQVEKARAGLEERFQQLQIKAAKVKGKTVYRLFVAGFHSKGEAIRFRNQLGREKRFQGAWVSRG